jgi:hypothetical protein
MNKKFQFSRKYVVAVIAAFISMSSFADTFGGVVIDDSHKIIKYPIVKDKNNKDGVIGDNNGEFLLKLDSMSLADKVVVSCPGYISKEYNISDVKNSENDTIVLTKVRANSKVLDKSAGTMKTKVKGKKHSGALLTSCIADPVVGEGYGYEFHADEGKRLTLNKVGFYYRKGDNQMSKMTFRINVYDMSNVKSSDSSDFKYVLDEPIYFNFALSDKSADKYEFTLPEQIVLPRDAMVEIEFVESLNGEIFWFKSNLVGKSVWAKSMLSNKWYKMPFASPFYVEYSEVKL